MLGLWIALGFPYWLGYAAACGQVRARVTVKPQLVIRLGSGLEVIYDAI